MNRTDAPKKQPVPFGVNGPREDLLPTTPAGDNTASYDAGFPPVTMILKSAGGLPPKGQDMNQILFELSSICRWFTAGALNEFDATFASSIGGYPKASVLVGDDGTTIYISTIDANSNNPNSVTTGWLNLSKITAIAALSGGANKLPYFSGANTAAQTDFTDVGRSVVAQTSIANLLTYLGLGDVKLAGVASGSLGASGFVIFPLIISGVRREFLIQWSGVITFDAATSTVMAKKTWTFPTAFPNACLGVFPTMARGNTYSPSASPTCSAKDPTLTSVELGCGYYASTAAINALAIGW
ncbi:phage tail protein [Cronobacter sakazakii]|nr:phage tail protein [Cronobacter sakazakii]